jgi:hypothetical protein
MGSDDEIVELPQWVVCRQWLFVEYVQNSARNLTLFESLQESAVLYQRATGDVDQISALFHHRKLLFA